MGKGIEASGCVGARWRAGWQVAILLDRRRFPSLARLRDLVHEARCRVDPDQERAVEERAVGDRGVWFDHQTSTASAATTTVSAVLGAWDALDLDAALGDVARDLRASGDSRGVDLGRAEALGLLAHPQRVLDLGQAADDTDAGSGTGTGTEVVSTNAMCLGTSGPGGAVEPTAGSVINLYCTRTWPTLPLLVLTCRMQEPGRWPGTDAHGWSGSGRCCSTVCAAG